MDLFKESVRYVIDTSSLIDLWRWFRPTVAPGAWTKLEILVEERIVVSVEEVLEELGRQDDRVLEWALDHRSMFVPLTREVQLAGKKVLSSHPSLLDYKKRTSTADPFVIGLARLYGAAVVTEEKPAGRGARPKIPNVCKDLGIGCIGLVDMFEATGTRLELRSVDAG